MSENAIIFKNFLESTGINGRFIVLSDGDTGCEIIDKLKCGLLVRIFIIFDQEEQFVSLRILEYIKLNDDTDLYEIYKILNDLNYMYRTIKFCLNKDNGIEIECNETFKNNYDPFITYGSLRSISNAANEEYNKIMKAVLT